MRIIDRFDMYMAFRNLNDNQVTVNCHLSVGLLGKARKGESDLGKKAIDKILSIYQDIDKIWLLTGAGEMIKKPVPSDSNSTNGQSTSKESCLVPVLPTEAQAGFLSEFADSVQDYNCEMMISPVKDATMAMAVCGDSMIPEYPSGSRVLLKKVNEKAFIEWGKVYVLDTENGAVIKEIHQCDDEDYIECVSQNPDPKYAPFKVPKASIFGWYKVIMVLSFK